MNSGNRHFDRLVAAGKPIGEVIAVNKYIIQVSGLQPCSLNALVMFDDGSKGFVYRIYADHVTVLHLGKTPVHTGAVAVLQHQDLVCKVGRDFIGRIVTVTGDPLDGKGPIAADAVMPIYNDAPPIYERELVEDQVESGVVAIDALFPLVRGQRMALLGDSKSGKSTVVSQLATHQRSTDQIVVYCLIAKRRADIDMLIDRLQRTDSMSSAIVVVSTMFDSLITNYIAPYVACSMAEYLWKQCGQDTIIVYDDLTSHALVYREVSLLSGVSPGRDSYPGDIFYAHSSLLERAGRLKSNGKCLTAIPVIHAAAGDITAFLPTNIMSMTDGQWIIDIEKFRSGIRPAISTGLSVTRAGGVGHNNRQKRQAATALKTLADYRRAQEFSHFGSELGPEAKKTLTTGDNLYAVMTQNPMDTYSLYAQQLMFDIVLSLPDGVTLDVNGLKMNANDFGAKIEKDEDFDKIRDLLYETCTNGDAAQLKRSQAEEVPTPNTSTVSAPVAAEGVGGLKLTENENEVESTEENTASQVKGTADSAENSVATTAGIDESDAATEPTGLAERDEDAAS